MLVLEEELEECELLAPELSELLVARLAAARAAVRDARSARRRAR